LGIEPESVDILVDHGERTSMGQQRTLGTMWSMVRPGGYYIIEEAQWNAEDKKRKPFEEFTNEILTNNRAFFVDATVGEKANRNLVIIQKSDGAQQADTIMSDRVAKGHQYVKAYESLFGDKRNRIGSVLECGVGTGQSLQMWQHYFPKAKIHGLDLKIQPVVENKFKDSTRVSLHTANGQHQHDVEGLKTGTHDIVVDDGNHGLGEQEKGLTGMWSLVRPGGYYIMEDVEWNKQNADATEGTSMMEQQYQSFNRGILRQSTKDILDSNAAFLVDPLQGDRNVNNINTIVEPWDSDREKRTNRLVVIHKREDVPQ